MLITLPVVAHLDEFGLEGYEFHSDEIIFFFRGKDCPGLTRSMSMNIISLVRYVNAMKYSLFCVCFFFFLHVSSTYLFPCVYIQNVTVAMTSVSGHLLGLEFKAPYHKW